MSQPKFPNLVSRFVAIAVVVMTVAAGTSRAAALPTLSLTTAGGSATSASIVRGTTSVTLGLRFDSADAPVGSLLYHIVTSPAGVARYASSGPVTALGTPFTTADLTAGLAPVPGATVTGGMAGSTQWFKSTPGDHAAFSGEIAWYTFDTSAMPADTYVFTVIGDEFANDATAADPVTTFGNPGTFTLTISAVPEPSTALTIATLAVLAAAKRTSRRDRTNAVQS